MTTPLAVLNVVGLSRSLLGDSSPNLNALVERHALSTWKPTLPAVTCTAQSTLLTGVAADEHGIVGNGWYDREQAQVQFWKQSNHLVDAPKLWEIARRHDPSITTANMFWWYNMYSSAEYSVTPRPMYKADGRKIPDVYSHPPGLRGTLQQKLGRFPLFNFWGPASSVVSSQWIADASIEVHSEFNPTLTLVYLPHLDYGLQKLGPDHPEIPKHVAEIDAIVGQLVTYFDQQGVTVIVVSEYGIEPVRNPIRINEALRRKGLLGIRTETGHELLDAGASRAFAVADHQVAHVYVRDESDLGAARHIIESLDGVAEVLDRDAMAERGINHARSGELLAVAESGSWFCYHYWLDDERAPDFGRTVDIHNKPGYDPAELFLDPKIRFPKLAVLSRLVRKKLGFRTLMDVIPLDPTLVKGSHGRDDVPDELRPVYIGPAHATGAYPDTGPEVHACLLSTLLG